MHISETAADKYFFDALHELDTEEKIIVFDAALKMQKEYQDDWLLSLLCSPHREFTLGDALAYLRFCTLIQEGKIYLATFACESFARSNSANQLNQGILDSIDAQSGIVEFGSVNNSSQGHDGMVRIENYEILQLLSTDEECLSNTENKSIIIKNQSFPVEIGSISLTKAVASIVANGGLFRLPYSTEILRDAAKMMSEVKKGVAALFVYTGKGQMASEPDYLLD